MDWFLKTLIGVPLTVILLFVGIMYATSRYGFSDPRPDGTESVCLEMVLVNNRLDTACYDLPIRRSAFQVNTNKGSYYLAYVSEAWWDNHWRTVRNGVIDFKEIHP